jgi:hypothetical protein
MKMGYSFAAELRQTGLAKLSTASLRHHAGVRSHLGMNIEVRFGLGINTENFGQNYSHN